jgi:hypothetical protein
MEAMGMRWPHVVTALGAVGAVVSMFGVTMAIRGAGGSVPVYFAARTIPPYTRIAPGDLKEVMVAGTDVVPGAVAAKGQIVGHMTSISVPVNTEIQSSELSGATSYQALLTTMDVNHEGLIEASIPTNGDAMVGVIKPGDKVILGAGSGAEIPNVTVLSVPTVTRSYGVTQTSGALIVAMPLSDYNQIRNQLNSVQILLMNPNDSYTSMIQGSGIGVQSFQNPPPQSQNPPVQSSTQGPQGTSSVKPGVPTYFAPPKENHK